MAQKISIPKSADKAELYQILLPQIRSLIASETDLTANLANIAAILKTTFNFFWVGFYRREGDELILAPFQGPLACTRIALGRGVCGAAARERRTIIVPDVAKFPDHIACSSESASEIVVPLIVRDKTQLILDVDSDRLNAFDEADRDGLEAIVGVIAAKHF